MYIFYKSNQMAQIFKLNCEFTTIIRCLILIQSCTIYDDHPPKSILINTISEKITDQASNKQIISKSNPILLIAHQLNDHLNEGDYFFYDQDLNVNNSIPFLSVHDFIEFKNDQYLYFDQVVISQMDGYFQSRFRIIINSSIALNISVFQKLDDEDLNLNYNIKDISSTLTGANFGQEWEQIDYQFLYI